MLELKLIHVSKRGLKGKLEACPWTIEVILKNMDKIDQ